MKTSHFSRKGPLFIGINVLISAFLILLVVMNGDILPPEDVPDAFIETLKTLVHFSLFCICSMIKLPLRLKWLMLSGLLFTQLGMSVDTLDEFYSLDINHWNLWGDLTYLCGLILVSVGAAIWGVASHNAAIKDTLTGVYNRRYFDQLLEHYISGVKRNESIISLLCIDLDNFKSINDNHGHTIGDKVLKNVSTVLLNHGRDMDITCRSGGEEFEVLMPSTDIKEAGIVASRYLEKIRESTPLELSLVTASIGVTQLHPNDTLLSVRKRADDAMYIAKRKGKDQVIALEYTESLAEQDIK